jgi:hypothetical protein
MMQRKSTSGDGTKPYLNVMVQSGYYDGACDYFNANTIYGKWIPAVS